MESSGFAERLSCVEAAAELPEHPAEQVPQRGGEAVAGPDQAGFVPLAKRWIVERSLGWIMRARRNCRDCERLPRRSESLIPVDVDDVDGPCRSRPAGVAVSSPRSGHPAPPVDGTLSTAGTAARAATRVGDFGRHLGLFLALTSRASAWWSGPLRNVGGLRYLNGCLAAPDRQALTVSVGG
ncbi:predicted protein [Streptomyces sp. AA4]|nr:predicted protein [Streptomyces sp. AA4]